MNSSIFEQIILIGIQIFKIYIEIYDVFPHSFVVKFLKLEWEQMLRRFSNF